jgi:hypothetical protein
MSKTILGDLDVIKCRSQGVAEEISETQQTVLAKSIKDRVRSIKGCGWTLCVKVEFL